jgi:hypothetical protein
MRTVARKATLVSLLCVLFLHRWAIGIRTFLSDEHCTGVVPKVGCAAPGGR